MPTRCNRGFFCRSYCLLNMFRVSPCPSSGAQEYYTAVAACGILCCGFSSSWSGVELRVYASGLHILTMMHGQNHIKLEVSVFTFLCYRTLEHIWSQQSFLQKNIWPSVPNFSQQFSNDFFCHPPFLITTLGSFSFRNDYANCVKFPLITQK